MVTTDASHQGWIGGYFFGKTVQSKWFLMEANFHINVLEMRVVLVALQAFQDCLIMGVISIQTNNMSVVCCINKLRNPILLLVLRGHEDMAVGNLFTLLSDRTCSGGQIEVCVSF